MGRTVNIGAKLTLDGVNEIQQSAKKINNALSEITSEGKLLDAQYRETANSMEALTKKGDHFAKKKQALAQKIEHASKAQKHYANEVERLGKVQAEKNEKLNAATEELEALESSTGDTTARKKELTEEISKLKKELTTAGKSIERAEQETVRWSKAANNAEAELIDLNREIKKNEKYLDEAAQSADGTASSIDNLGKQTKSAEDSISDFAAALSALGVAGGISAVIAFLDAAIKAAQEFEVVMAGIGRATNASGAELDYLADGVMHLASVLPIPIAEIGKMVETAAGLGIATENVIAFTEMVAKLGPVMKGTSEQTAKLLAKFMNMIEIDPADFNRLGSVIAYLGDNTQTTADSILVMSQRMEGAGAAAGMSAPEIMAIAAGIGSVGMEAGAGSSSMNRLINSMIQAVATGRGLNQFADVAGMSAAEFAVAWGDNAAGALGAFISGLQNAEQNGRNMTVMLDELGIRNVQDVMMLQNLAKAQDDLASIIGRANDAWDQNTALTDAAGRMFETTDAKIQRAQNSFNMLAIAIGNELNPAIGNLADLGGGAALAMAQLIEDMPWLVDVMTGAVAAGSVLMAVFAGKAVAASKAALAIKALGLAKATLKFGPLGLLVGAAVTAFTLLSGRVEEVTTALDALNDRYDDTIRATDASAIAAGRHLARLQELEEKLATLTPGTQEHTAAQAQYAAVVGLLNETIPSLNLVIDEQTGLIEGNTDAIRESIDAWEEQARKQAALDLQREAIEEQARAYADYRLAVIDAAEAYERLREGRENIDTSAPVDSVEFATATAKIAELERAFNTASAAVDDARGTYEAFAPEIARTNQLVADFTAVTEDAADAQPELANAIDILTKEIEGLNRAYESAKATAETSIRGQLGLMREMDTQATVSAQTIQQNLDSQETFLTDFHTNAQALRNREIDGIDRLLDHFGDFTADNGAMLAGLAGAYDECIEDIIATLKRIDEGTEAVASELAQMDVDVRKYAQMVEDRMHQIADEFGDAGVNAITSLMAGLDSKVPTLNARVAAIANGIAQTLRDALEIRSPSRVGVAIGANYIESVGIGAVGMMGYVLGQVERFGVALASALRQPLTDSSTFDFSGTAMGEAAALEAFRTASTEINHLRAMRVISEEEFYDRLLSLRNEYLRDYGNLSEWRRVTETIFRYQKSLVQSNEDMFRQELATLNHHRAMQRITEEEFYARLLELRDTFLDEYTDMAAWRQATEAHFRYQQNQAEGAFREELATLTHARNMQRITEEEFYEQLLALRDEFLDEYTNTAAWRQVTEQIFRYQQSLVQSNEDMFRQAVAQIDFLRALDLISAEDYYRQLAELRDRYLEETTEAWKRVTVQMHNLRQNILQQEQRQREEAKRALVAQNQAWLRKRKDQINEELRLERERLNGIIDNINAEIAARRRQRQETNFEDNVSAAQRRIDVIQAKLAFERDADNRAELEKELTRAQQAKAREQQNFDDWQWENAQRDRIEGIRRQITAAERNAQNQIQEAEAEAARRLAASKKRLNNPSQTPARPNTFRGEQVNDAFGLTVNRMIARYYSELGATDWQAAMNMGAYRAMQMDRELRATGGSEWDLVRHLDSGGASGTTGWSGANDAAWQAALASNQTATAAMQSQMQEIGIKSNAITNATSAHSVDNTRNANVTINNHGGQMTSGQIAAAVDQALEQLSRQ